MTSMIEEKIKSLSGPILVLGASGFVGANFLRKILAVRQDVFGTVGKLPAWRLEGISSEKYTVADLKAPADQKALLANFRPKTVFDFTAYGAYPFQGDVDQIYATNFLRLVPWCGALMEAGVVRYVHAGSSSEYGNNAGGPVETSFLSPNSDYSVSKCAAAQYLHYLGKSKKFACANVRLYSAYGPYEDASRLIPQLVKSGLEGKYPSLTDPEISRDFIYIDDVCEAFISIALHLSPEFYGESFNVGSGKKTTLRDLAFTAKTVFSLLSDPVFGEFERRNWDVKDWFANIEKLRRVAKFEPQFKLEDGLRATAAWQRSLIGTVDYEQTSKKTTPVVGPSISVVIACYKDGQAIPVMYQRLTDTLRKIGSDYEIIFVNDCSPDDSEEKIRAISERDGRVRGISHSRNFGSQAAFRSGMAAAKKGSVVLMDGDLQDPPELIEAFVEKWRAGFDVVYGVRVKREAPIYMQVAYKAFYLLFKKFSYVPIPRDAGDFSLMDRRVVRHLLEFPERDVFLRGLRAFVGFKQTGVDYIRPERLFGVTTNSFLKNLGWAKKGIFSFSNVPLNVMSLAGFLMFGCSLLLVIFQLVLKMVNPESAPHGVTSILILVAFFGALNFFGLSLIGEYLGKVFEEVKQRPHFIRRSEIENGEITSVE